MRAGVGVLRAAAVGLATAFAVLAAVPAQAETPRPARDGVLSEYPCPWANTTARTLRCYRLTVPEARPPEGGSTAASEHRTVTLSAAVFRARGSGPALTPVVLVSGGPGAITGLDAQTGVHWNQELRRLTWLGDRDLILFDARGVGTSRPVLDCPEVDALRSDPLDTGAYRKAVGACRDRWKGLGIDLAGYDTNAIAADVEALRIALGYREWIVWGQSYGTRVALTVARHYPRSVAAMILDGVFPPEAGPNLNWVDGTVGAIDAVFGACAADRRCARRYPDLPARFEGLLRRLAEAPVRVVSRAGHGMPEVVHEVDDVLMMLVVESMLYSGDGVAKLPRLIDRLARRGNWNALAEPLKDWDESTYGPLVTTGAGLVIDCNDDPQPNTDRERMIARERPVYANWIGHVLATQVCDILAPGREAAMDFTPVPGTMPALLLSGRFDPATPPHWARLVARTYGAAHLFEVPDKAHDPIENECARAAVAAFLERPMQVPEPACRAGMRGPRFE